MFFYCLTLVLATFAEPDIKPVSHTFIIDKPYVEVLAKVYADKDRILKEAGEEILESKDNKRTLVYNSVDGFYLKHEQLSRVEIKLVGEMWVKHSIAVKRHGVYITEEMHGDNDYFYVYKSRVKIYAQGFQTVVESEYFVESYSPPRFIMRGILRSMAKKMETAIRETSGTALRFLIEI